MRSILFKYGICCVLLLLLAVPSVFAEPVGKRSHLVLIDPAHGGTDSGVTISSRVAEKNVTLAIALSLKKYLEAADPKIKVQMTRSADKTVSVDDRIGMVKSSKPDLLISLHANAGFGPEASGFEIIIPGQKKVNGNVGIPDIVKDMEKTKYTNDSVRLAQKIQKSLEKVFPRKSRGIRQVPVPILTALYAPSICVEMGFLTNKHDKDKLLDKEGQQDIAGAIGRGIRDYFNQ
ncbi:MAG: N-acetylmuramoyl-L-alanine amidase [Syntrophaceae bacterium]|nr:N-acetylmuramoyl-L-alanine amidase [Syntrophaceae bacterium]